MRSRPPQQQRSRGFRHDEKGGKVEAVVDGRCGEGILDKLPEHFCGSDPRGDKDHKHLLEVHDFEEVMNIFIYCDLAFISSVFVQ